MEPAAALQGEEEALLLVFHGRCSAGCWTSVTRFHVQQPLLRIWTWC